MRALIKIKPSGVIKKKFKFHHLRLAAQSSVRGCQMLLKLGIPVVEFF